MGQKLKSYYDFVVQKGGATARMRLAMMTNISSAKAETEPDSPENIQKFREAIKKITGQDAPN